MNHAFNYFRCSLQHECANFDKSNYWISASEGVQQCPSMTILPSEISVDKENQVGQMTIVLSLGVCVCGAQS